MFSGISLKSKPIWKSKTIGFSPGAGAGPCCRNCRGSAFSQGISLPLETAPPPQLLGIFVNFLARRFGFVLAKNLRLVGRSQIEFPVAVEHDPRRQRLELRGGMIILTLSYFLSG
jgi:hypothetical protein